MFTTLLQTLLDKLLPPRCTNCKAADDIFCQQCWTRIDWIEPPICKRCGRRVAQENTFCATCYHKPNHLQTMRAAVWFGRPVRRVIHQLKYHQQTSVVPPLADMMVSSWKVWHCDSDLIIPIPLHPERERERGYNQATLLAKQFATATATPLDTAALFRILQTEQQAKLLTRADRINNVSGAFMADRKRVQGQRILLVDDVVTTGATLNAAAEALLTNGAASVSAYCLARAHGN